MVRGECVEFANNPFGLAEQMLDQHLGDGSIVADPRTFEIVNLAEGTDGAITLQVLLVPGRSARPHLSSEVTCDGCPLCTDALTNGLVAPVDDEWSATVNKYPAMEELLLVRNEHRNGLDTNTLYKWHDVASRVPKVSVLYSSDINSIPCHTHATLSNYSFPIFDAPTLKLTEDVGILQNYPASVLTVEGESATRANLAESFIQKLHEQGISFNVIISADRTYIHPLVKTHDSQGKKIAAREVAGVISTSRQELFDSLCQQPDLAAAALREVSFGEDFLKNLVTGQEYTYEQFFADSGRLAGDILEWQRENGRTIDQIVGVTRGGIALGSVLKHALGTPAITLAGCYIETNNAGQTVHWKTPLSTIEGKVVLLTTDLFRSGNIIAAIAARVRALSPDSEVLVAASHYFTDDNMEPTAHQIKPDFLAHTLGSSVFMSYPWERSPKDDENTQNAVIPKAELLANDLAHYVTDPSKIAVVGIGYKAILVSAVVSQRLSIRSVFGLDEAQALAEHAPDAAQNIVDNLSDTQDIILIADNIPEKEDFIRGLCASSCMRLILAGVGA
jgi:hypoxanthine phosphoribosyltransferase